MLEYEISVSLTPLDFLIAALSSPPPAPGKQYQSRCSPREISCILTTPEVARRP